MSVIAILTAIGMININQFFESNRRKAVIAETNQIATALSFAEQDLQFYPRMNYLNRSKKVINFGRSDAVVPRLDYHGFLTSTPAILPRILAEWKGPYMGISPNRGSRGVGGVVQMRCPDVTEDFNGIDFSLVLWPADQWGQPYLLYQLKTELVPDSATGNVDVLPFFITDQSEEGDFMTAVVSYGRNRVPGGNANVNQAFIDNVLEPGALWVRGDSVPGGTANFTLRTATATDPNLRLENNSAVWGAFVQALSVELTAPATYSIDDGRVGTIDDGSDDIILNF